MASGVGGSDKPDMADVLDLPLLEDIAPLTSPAEYGGAGACLSQLRVPIAVDLRQDGVLVRPPSYPCLWDVKEDPYSHILDPGTEEPGNLQLNDQLSEDLSFQSSPSSPQLGGTSSMDGLDSSPGDTSPTDGVEERGRLGAGLFPGGRAAHGSGSSSEFMCLFNLPGDLEAPVRRAPAERLLGEDQRNGLPSLAIELVPKQGPDVNDGQAVDLSSRLRKSDHGRRTATRGSGRARPLGGGHDVDPELPPEEAKRVRRMLSNRESARRSRHRKQAHLQELENQVSQLAMEKEQLEEQLDEMEDRMRTANGQNNCLRNRVISLKGKLLKFAAAMRGEGPMPSAQDLEDDDVMNSSGSATQIDHNGSYQDEPMTGSRQNTTGILKMRRHKARATRPGLLERNSKRNCL